MKHFNSNKAKFLITGLLFTVFLLVSSCQNWMSNDDFISKIENEVHDANAAEISVYVRFANDNMGKTEPSGSTTMKVDVASRVSAVPADAYGFVKWAAFSSKDFATNKNHSKLTYISEEAYNRDFKKLEVPADEVIFSTPNEPITDVIIKKNRSDLFLIPIVAARPSIVQSVPSGGDVDVVKNTSIRILFSKAIDGDTLLDSEGNLNFSVTTSEFSFGEENQEIEPKDITDFFDYNLSTSGKMLTLSLKEKLDENGNKTGELANLLDNYQNITITLFEGICDTDGYAMNGNFFFKFTTGTSTDSLAPIIDVIFGGTDQNCDVFVSFHNVDSNGNAVIDGKATDASKNAPKDINSAEYTDALVAQRIYDKLNIFVKATDIISSGNGAINPNKDLSENKVNAIGIAASLWLDKDGKAVKLDNKTTIARKNHIYIPSTIDPNCQITEIFNEVVPLDKDGNKYNGGTIYTYDVSKLLDGLIKIDVWGVDMTGNSGAPAEDGSPNKTGSAYYDKHDNSYKSIFVVKDTTAPDAAEEAKKLLSNSAAAPYYWYNNTTLKSMQLYDIDTNQIVDAGHAKLRSLTKNLSWNFAVGKADTAPAANNDGWKYIHDQDTGASIKYTLASAEPPAKDGPVDITMFIRDDIGNVSDPVLLKSVMYDNTQPTVTLLNDYGDFVNEEGGKELHSSKDPLIPQILKVAFTEPNVDNNGSGIRRIDIHVKKGNTEVAVPLDQNAFKVKWSTEANAIPKTAHEIEIAEDDAASTNNLKAFKVNDSSKITTGTLFIYGLTLGDEDGAYDVTVDLYDSAMNKTTTTETTKISRDNTSPVINTVKIQDAQSRVVYGDATGTKTWWMPKEKYESGNLTKVALTVASDEAGSGLETIKVGNDVEFTSATILKKGNVELIKGTDYKFDESDPTHTIILLNNFDVKLKGTPIEFTLENVKLKTINNGAGNKINIEVKDFVGNTPASNKIENKSDYQIVYPDNTTGTLVYADNTPPSIAVDSIGETTLHVEDTIHDSTKNPDKKAYDKDNFTDSRDVVLTLKLTAESTTNGSGVKTIHLTDNAVFTDSTAIFIDNSTTPLNNADYTFADDKKSVDFTKVFTADNQIKFTNVRIISETPGAQIIKADLTDFVGLKSTASTNTNTIVVDNTDPVIDRINWVTNDANVTVGSEGDWTIDTQRLKINFIEATAGVKAIKFDIHLSTDNTNTFENPFEDGNFELYYNSTTLTKNVDYIIDTNKQYIILTKPKTSGTFEFQNIKLTNTNVQGNYAIDVKLLDAAENVIDCTKSIAIDNDPPVVTGKLLIKDLVHSKELYSGEPALAEEENMPGTGHHWLRQSYVGSGTDKAADSIPVIITIEEKGSGIKVITFGEDAVLSSNTQLWKADNYGNGLYDIGNPIEGVEPVQYTVNTQKNTITIDDSINALNANGDNLEFKILVKNVGLKTEKTDTSTTASKNRITVKVQDVAMHDSGTPVDTYESYIYSDSRIPDSPTNFKLLDRAYSKTDSTPTIAASENYTNDSIVDMEFELSDSEKFGSGYHMFRISGAKFTADSVITMTKKSNGSEIKFNNSAIPFVISSSDTNNPNKNDILTLKTTGANADNYVVRQAVKVKITNVQLLNGNLAVASDSEKEVLLTAYDLIGRYGSAASDKIWFDDTPPEFEKIFTANYTDSTISYYKPSINVYPHPTGTSYEDATGVSINYGTDTEPLYVPTFYTATYYDSGLYQVNGQVSSTSSSVNTTFIHGAVLGIRANDTKQLGGLAVRNNGDTSAKTFLYYYHYSSSETPFTKTKSQILTSGTNLSTDKRGYRSSTSSSNPGTSEALWFGFQTDNNDSTANITGKYSAVIVDEAGNCSDVFHFAVVQDTGKPAKSTTAGDIDNLNERVLLQMPDALAKAYNNASVSVSKSTEFPSRYYAYQTSGYDIRTKKYVTKQTDNKYKIQLNLGGTVSSPTLTNKIDGSAASNVSSYSDLSATASSAPIEAYAVSTWYGSWPIKDDSTYKYSPVVPTGTSFPSGETLGEVSYTNSLATSLGKNYFGYGSNPEANAWRTPTTTSTLNWHSYKYISGSTPYTDSANSISSYVDSNNNLIIEIPNTQSTVPISVFLKDGCGNMEYVVCGLDKTSNGTEYAVSFVVDNKLGYTSTTDGKVSTPIVIQNPYMTYSTSPQINWPYSTSTYGYSWNKTTGNGLSSEGGEGARRGFIKDNVKYATYYNPYIWDNSLHDSSYEANKVKIGLTLRFDSTKGQRGSPEDVLFDSSLGLGKVADPDPDSADTSKSDYTVRALLYCTQSADKPTYEQIISKAANTKNSYGGFRTEWVGVRTSNDSTKVVEESDENYATADYKISQTTILLDYPTPDYSSLGWNTKEDNGEPKPYYIWYIFEDRVGNFEIGKIVNSYASGSDLTGSKSGMFDRWLYDNEAPNLTIRGTSTDPSTITAANIGQLVATNNGFVPYAEKNSNGDYTGNIYIHADKDNSTVRVGGSKNTNAGTGTTHLIHSYQDYTIYNPFVDIEVSERTGIRAFAWTTSDNSSFDFTTTTSYYGYDNSWYSANDTDAKKHYWYTSYATMSSITKDIGVTINYDSHPELAYFYGSSNYVTYTGSNSNSKYSGVKLFTVIPYGKLSTTTPDELWLHVMDWTGNIKHYRMGASGVKFKNDSTAPTYTSTEGTGTVVPDQYYIQKGTGAPTVRIAGNGSYANTTDKKDIKLYIPTSYFTETGSGIKGFSFNGDGTGIEPADDGGLYLTLTYDNYHYNDTNSHSLNYYIYDNVGNRKQLSLNIIYDNIAPKIENIALVIKGSTNHINKIADTRLISYETVEHPEWGFDCYENYSAKPKNGESKGYTQYQASLDNVPTEVIQNIYINKSNVTKLHINIDNTVDHSDIVDVIVNKWNGSAWEEKSSVAKWIANPDSSTVPKWFYEANTSLTTTNIFHMGSDNTDGYDTLEYNRDGTYYQIVAQDISGNTCCQYFKLILDDEAPSLTKNASGETIKPAITLGKGSIGKIGTTYYYTADSSSNPTLPLTLNFAVTKNTGVGTIDSRFWYSKNGTSGWTLIENNSAAKIPYTSGSIEKIYIKDCFDNILEYSSGFTYSYDWVETIETITWEDVVDDQGGTYKVRHKTVTTQNHSENEPISKLTYYSGSAPTISETLTDITNNVGNYIYTYGPDTNNNTEDWRNSLVETTDGDSDGDFILIKNKEQSKLRIILTPPANSNIIGYVVKDSDTSTPSTDPDTYSMGHGVQGTKQADGKFYIEEDIYDINKGSTFTRWYYAVDLVGNISTTPLKVTYTFKNPHAASNVELIKDPLTSDKVPNDVKAQLIEDDLVFTDYYDFKDSSDYGNKWDSKKSGFRYFSDNYMVIRCTLFKPADKDTTSPTYYEDTPIKVELVDVWKNDNGSPGSGNRGWSYAPGDTGYDNYFRLYTSTDLAQDTETGRYYCWIVFKPKSDFNNNTKHGGGVINAVIYGVTSKTDHCPLNEDAVKQHGWQMDKTAPTISGKNGNNDYITNGILWHYSVTGTTQEIQDNNVEDNKKTVAYSEGLKINVLETAVKDPNKNSSNKDIISSGLAKYRFDYEGNTSTAWTDIGNAVTISGNNYYQFTLPPISAVHKHVYLKIKDKTGNITTYQLAAADNNAIVWWIRDNRLPEDGTNVTWTDATWSANANDYTFKVNLPEGSIIKKVSVKVDGHEKDSSNAKWGTVKFNGYKAGSQTPSLNGSTGWLVVNNGTAQGLDITVKKIPQDWANHTIEIKINDNDNLKKTYENFVTPKTFTADDVTIGVADANGVVTLSSPTEAPLATYITAVKAKVGNTEIGATLSDGNTKVTLSGLPPETWSEQKVTLYINPTDEDADGIKSKDVLTIPAKKLGADNIILTPVNWESGKTEYEVSVALKDGETALDIGLLEGMTFSAGIEDSQVTLDKDNSKFSMTGISVTQGWQAQTVKITISGDNVSGSVEKVAVNVEPKNLSAADVDISDADATGVVTLSSNTGAPLGTYITAVKAKVGNTEIDAALSDDKTKVTLSGLPSKTWSEQKVTLYINPTDGTPAGIKSKDVLTIPAIQTTDISIGTAAWSEADNAYVATLTYSNGAPTSAITRVSSTKATVAFAKQADGTTNDTTKILITGLPAKTWASQPIDVTIIDGGDTNKITKDDVYTVDALVAGDFTVTGTDTYSNGEYTIAMAEGSDLPSIEAGDFSAGEGNSVTWESPKATVTVTQGWTEQTIILTLKGLELKTITVPAKTITSGDITFAMTANGHIVTEYANDIYYLEFALTPPTGVTISKVTSGGSELTPNNGKYAINGNGSPIPQTVTISVVTNAGTIENIRLFPPTGNENRISTGLNILSGGLSQASKWNETQDSGIMNFITALDPFASVEELPVNAAKDKKAAKAKKAGKTTAAATSAKSETKAAPDAAPAAQIAQVSPIEQLVQIEQLEQIEQAALSAITEEVTAIDSAAISTQAKAPDQITPLASQASADTLAVEAGSNSKAVLWIILCMFCIAVAGVVFGFKKKEEK